MQRRVPPPSRSHMPSNAADRAGAEDEDGDGPGRMFKWEVNVGTTATPGGSAPGPGFPRIYGLTMVIF